MGEVGETHIFSGNAERHDDALLGAAGAAATRFLVGAGAGTGAPRLSVGADAGAAAGWATTGRKG